MNIVKTINVKLPEKADLEALEGIVSYFESLHASVSEAEACRIALRSYHATILQADINKSALTISSTEEGS